MKTTPVIITLFFLSFIIHLIGLNIVGRTWDEPFKIDNGYIGWRNVLRGNFDQESWKNGTEHPMIAKYIYGLAAIPHFHKIESLTVPYDLFTKYNRGDYILSDYKIGTFLVDYDFTIPRLFSIVFNSLTITFIYLVARRWISPTSAFLGATSVLFIPRFIAMGQLVTFESLSTAMLMVIIYKFIYFKKNLSTYLTVAFISALLFWTRYNNSYVFLLIAGFIFMQKDFNWKWICIPIFTLFIGFISWPYLWSNTINNFLSSFFYHPNPNKNKFIKGVVIKK
jgi:hypothetical protein